MTQPPAKQGRRLEGRYWKVQPWLYGGDRDTDVSNESYRLVKIRKPQPCSGPYHEEGRYSRIFPAGTPMILETAVVDGVWASCYTCEHCIAESKKEVEP